MLEIKLTSEPAQLFTIPLNGASYGMRVIYNTRAKMWTIDISRAGVDLVTGVPLIICGDILRPYPVELSGLYVVNVASTGLDATAFNLGTDVKLYHILPEEIASVASV